MKPDCTNPLHIVVQDKVAMQLSSLFKKSTPPEPAVSNSSHALEKVKKAQAATLEFLPILKAKLTSSDGSVHAGTMLASAAWLAGTSLRRSFNFKVKDPPGTFIKSSDVNRE